MKTAIAYIVRANGKEHFGLVIADEKPPQEELDFFEWCYMHIKRRVPTRITAILELETATL